MKAAFLYAPGKISVDDVEPPKVGPKEILVRTEVALTCGTDLKLYKRGHPLAKLPLIIGHEFAGIVSQVGKEVKNFHEGDRVVSVNSAPCDECYFCCNGQQNLCENLGGVIGFSTPGAYAEYLTIPDRIVAKNTLTIPESLSPEQAAILEPLACAVHGTDLSGIQKGESVAIIGSGPIGLLHLQLAKNAGASPVIISNRTSERLQFAKYLGADHLIISSQEDQVQRVLELTDGRGADVVIEAVGNPETWGKAVEMARKGGRVLMFGGCAPGTNILLDTYRLHYEELTVKGAFHHTPASVRKAMELISSRAVNAKAIITHRMKLQQTAEALDLMDSGKALKVSLSP